MLVLHIGTIEFPRSFQKRLTTCTHSRSTSGLIFVVEGSEGKWATDVDTAVLRGLQELREEHPDGAFG